MIIPSHGDVQREEQVELTLTVLGEQVPRFQSRPYDHPVTVVIADNGMTDDFGRFVRGCAEYHGLETKIINARPRNEQEKNPAFARNRALESIAREEPVPGDTIVFIDDDSTFGPHALEGLDTTLRERERLNTVAVFGNVVATPTLTFNSYHNTEWTTKGGIRVLPSLFKADGTYDLAAMVAFSSQVAGKLNGIAIQRHALDRFPTDSRRPFVTMPHKSGEDMAFMAALSRTGNIVQDSSITVLDPIRPDAHQTAQQQRRWGHDHVILATHLQKLGLLNDGLSVLEPDEDGSWKEWKLPGTEHLQGCVINPAEIRALVQHFPNLSQLGLSVTPDALQYSSELLDVIDAARGNSTATPRTDLPRQANNGCVRGSLDVKVSRLAGNLEGMFAQKYYAESPQTIVLGTRQQGRWV